MGHNSTKYIKENGMLKYSRAIFFMKISMQDFFCVFHFEHTPK
jgi:hypothetical protein